MKDSSRAPELSDDMETSSDESQGVGGVAESSGKAGAEAKDAELENKHDGPLSPVDEEKHVCRAAILVEGLRNTNFSAVSLKKHLDDAFPGVVFKARLLRGGLLRLFDFSSSPDCDLVFGRDWNDARDFPKGIPFGGTGAKRMVYSVLKPEFAVSLFVDRNHTEDEVREALLAQGYTDFEVSFIRRPRDSQFTGLVRVEFAREADVARARKDGLLLGYEKKEVELWSVEERVKRCHKCSKWGHLRSGCKNEARCAKCAGAHDIKDCDSRDVCCPNCGHEHYAWNRFCSAYLRAKRAVRSTWGAGSFGQFDVVAPLCKADLLRLLLVLLSRVVLIVLMHCRKSGW